MCLPSERLENTCRLHRVILLTDGDNDGTNARQCLFIIYCCYSIEEIQRGMFVSLSFGDVRHAIGTETSLRISIRSVSGLHFQSKQFFFNIMNTNYTFLKFDNYINCSYQKNSFWLPGMWKLCNALSLGIKEYKTAMVQLGEIRSCDNSLMFF